MQTPFVTQILPTNPDMPENSARLASEAVSAFVRAGSARFTLLNPQTGKRFTYKVSAPKSAPDNPQPDDAKPLFVSVLTGSDNDSDYSYLGVIFADSGFRVTRRSKISPDAPSALAFGWFWRRLSSGSSFEPCEVWHMGRCGRCGRALTDPESIAAGIGPKCEEMS
jgi:hypothetical protein